MGRPAFNPSAEERAEILRLRQAKVSIEEIARRLNVTSKTLRRACAAELGISSVETGETTAQQGEVLSPQPSAQREQAFTPSLEQRQRVTILAGARISNEEIARKMEVSVEMLKEHFARELIDGPATCKADIIESQYYAGRGGNVAAAKVYLTFNAQAQGDEDSPPPKVTDKGKKEIRQDRAEAAGTGTDWGDDLDSVAAVVKH